MSERVSARAAHEARAQRLARMMVLSALGAAVTAAGARITVPWWPVPATAQVFFVLLCGAALGPRWGAAAQAQYVAAGALGLPIFAGGRGGPAVLLGPTGGYIVGFVAAAYVTGRLTEAWGRFAGRPGGRPLRQRVGTAGVGFHPDPSVGDYATTPVGRPLRWRGGGRYVAAVMGAATVWLCGWAWLAAWAAAGGEAAPLRAAFTWGVAPFIALDMVKAIAAAWAGRAVARMIGA